MLFVEVIVLSVLALQTIHTAIFPCTMKAMAAIQVHKARAIANLLRARAHLNVAKARANLGLIDHRVIRNSDDPLLDEHDLDYDEENLPYLLEDYYEEINLPETDEDFARFLSSDSKLLESQNEFDDSVGINEGIINTGPDAANAYAQNLNLDDNNLEIPLDIDELDESNYLNCGVTNGNQDSNQRRETSPLRCERPTDGTNSQEDSVNPSLRMQAPFPQAFTTGQPQLAQQILVPWQLVPQGIPAMQILPQANPYANFPIQQLAGLQPGLSPQMVFLRQASLQDNSNDTHSDFENSSSHLIGSSRAADPGSFSHSHTHTHTHTHFKEPHRNIQVPNTQVILPGLNLHVVQNQNSVVSPQQIPIVSNQPDLNTAERKPIQINPGGITYKAIAPPPFPLINSGRQGGQCNIHGVRPGISASQSQFIQTNVPINNQNLITPNGEGNSFTQFQTNRGGPIEEPTVKMRLRDDPTDYLGQMDLPYSGLNPDNQKIENLITNSGMKILEPLDNFNSDPSQNLQSVINDMKIRGNNMNRLVSPIENDANVPYHFGAPLNQPSEFEYVRSPIYYEDRGNMQEETLGTLPTENINLNPLPTLPENFLELNLEQRQEAMKNYLDEERMNLENFLEQVDESNRRNMDTLSSLIDASPAFTPNSMDFQKDENNNPKDIQSELTGSFQYNLENIENSDGRIFYDDKKNLQHIIDVPQRHESEWFQRFARSLNQTDGNKLDKLLLVEKDVIKELKKDAKHDEDLMMIGYIGENMIKELEEKKNKTKRTKRGVVGSPYNLELNRLIIDPKARLDIPRTLDNLGAVVKNTFEHDNAPLYHVRNIVGSAQDAVLASMKIPTKNLLIPSQYDIVKKEENNPIVGDINPNLFFEKYSQDEYHPDNIANTFHKVGSVIRDSVLSGQEALSHVGQVANHAKSAIHSTRYTAPRLMLTRIPAVTSEPSRKAVLITPRIFDVVSETEPTETKLENSEGQFVRAGDILDAVGISNPNTNDVHFEKIIMEPTGTYSIFHIPEKSRPSKLLGNFREKVRVGNYKTVENKDLSNTLATLDRAKESLGVNSLKDFFDNLKETLNVARNKDIKPNEPVQKKQVVGKDSTQIPTQGRLDNREKNHSENPMNQKQEIVEMSISPKSLTHLLTRHDSHERHRLGNGENAQITEDQKQKARNFRQILGSINPMMFEKLLNESIKTENNANTTASIFYDRNEDNTDEIDNEEIGASIRFSEAMLKPFMGQANSKVTHEFFDKYMSHSEENEDESKEQEQTTETADSMEVDLDQGNELEK